MFLRSHAVDSLTWEAAQVAHKLCEQQAAEAKWLNVSLFADVQETGQLSRVSCHCLSSVLFGMSLL